MPKLMQDWKSRWEQAADCDDVDLLKDLADFFEQASQQTIDVRPPDCCQLLAELARSSAQAGWRLSRQLPDGDPTNSPRWMGARFFLWPMGIQNLAWRGIVSSRLPRALDHWPEWFCMLRQAISDAADDELLTFIPGTAGHEFVRRAAELFGKKLVRIDSSSHATHWQDWLHTCLQLTTRPANLFSPRVFVSPPLIPSDVEIGVDADLANIPERDRLLVVASRTIVALHIRRNGHVHRLLRRRLAEQSASKRCVRISLGKKLVTPQIRDELLSAGAVGWAVLGGSRAAEPADSWMHSVDTGVGESLPDGRCLTHCTRRRRGAWPDQSDREFHDDLILQRSDSDHSPLAALRRIIQTQRLVATGDGIRGGTRVVSFTSVPLAELHALRVFRPHRGRWDFEPYGLCLEIGCAQRLGILPVTYVPQTSGNNQQESLDVVLRQKAVSTSKRGGRINWTVEQEWRHVGDLDLGQLPRNAICVFVPTATEAQHLAKFSPWRVVVMPQ